MNTNLIALMLSSSDSDSDSSPERSCTQQYNLSSSGDEEFLAILLKEPRRKRVRIQGYFEETVPSYSDDEFKMNFRISRSLFKSLSKQMFDNIKSLRIDSRLNAAEKHMAVFLWFAGHEACTYRNIAARFGLSLWTVCHIIDRAICFLSGLSKEVISWPNAEKKKCSAEYFNLKGFLPGVIGAIGGSHIRIEPPSKGKSHYLDRKKEYSIKIQAVCDYERKFVDVFIGYPGSVNDTQMLVNSPIFLKLEQLCGEYYLLGNSAYTCYRHLLTPYMENDHLTAAQRTFNQKLSSCRVSIEHTFSMLKQRFRQLYFCKIKDIRKLAHFIRACCVLHNLSDQTDFPFDENFDPADSDAPNENDTTPRQDIDTASGTSLRDLLSIQILKKAKT